MLAPTGGGRAAAAKARPEWFTLLVLGDQAQTLRKVRLSRTRLRRAAWAAAACAALVAAALVHYAVLLRRGPPPAPGGLDAALVAEENAHLRAQLALAQERVGRIASTLDRVERLDLKLRSAAAEAQGPGPASPAADPGAARQGREKPGALTASLGAVEAHASRQESSMSELDGYFDAQRTLLATAPTGWPARGWVTSDFGVRVDPYTAERVMHHGLDIATASGQPVLSPSDGTVVFAGEENGYGKTLDIDHGFGVHTRYGHLSAILVKQGAKVKRGEKVASVGNTGRSTGPHLHYEVRVNGVPENPRKFILE